MYFEEDQIKEIKIGDLILWRKQMFSTGEEKQFIGYVVSVDQPFAKVVFISSLPSNLFRSKTVLYLDDDKPDWKKVS